MVVRLVQIHRVILLVYILSTCPNQRSGVVSKERSIGSTPSSSRCTSRISASGNDPSGWHQCCFLWGQKFCWCLECFDDGKHFIVIFSANREHKSGGRDDETLLNTWWRVVQCVPVIWNENGTKIRLDTRETRRERTHCVNQRAASQPSADRMWRAQSVQKILKVGRCATSECASLW